jgi:hypothetical protein
MFNRDWLSNLALAGCVIALILGAIAFRHVAASFQSVGAEEQHDRNHAGSQSSHGAATSASAKKLENPRIYELRCQAPESTEEVNLCIQRELADTARYMADLTRQQVLIGGLGFAALVITLLLSTYGTLSASQAVRIAKISERAWLSVERLALSGALRNSAEGLRLDLVMTFLIVGTRQLPTSRFTSKCVLTIGRQLTN